MCRKLCKGILAAVLALSVFSTGAMAAMPQYPGRLGHCNVYGTSVCADKDGNGVCDVHGSHCRRYGYSVRRHHMCRRPGGALCHFTADGSWVSCADADCNGWCDTCGAAFPVKAGNSGNAYGSAGAVGNSGDSYGYAGNSGSTGNSGNSYGSSGSAGNGSYGYGYYGGGHCGSGGHHSGHHGGHC